MRSSRPGRTFKRDLHDQTTTGSVVLGVCVHDRVYDHLAVRWAGWGIGYNRKLLLAGGVGLWSLATVGRGVFEQFLAHVLLAGASGGGRGQLRRDRAGLCSRTCFRSSSGAGRWGSITWRCRWARRWDSSWGDRSPMTLGWQAVFFVVGLPGLLAARRRTGDAATRAAAPRREPSPPVKAAAAAAAAITSIWSRRRPSCSTPLGMAAVTFATGAYAAWGSTFYQTCTACRRRDAGTVDRPVARRARG